MIGYAWLALNLAADSGGSSLPTPCLFKEITGLPCPSCGITRALLLLAHGNLSASLFLNPLGLLLALGMIALPVWVFIDVYRKSDSFLLFYLCMEKAIKQRAFAIPMALLTCLNWVWNISKGI